MSRKLQSLSAALLLAFAGSQANATVLFSDGFETAWGGNYAAGWENSAYRHGTAPVAQMMQQTTIAHSGSNGMKLIVDANPNGLFWVAVNPNSIPLSALDKQYNPYLSAWYYEENKTSIAGQIFAVPDTPIADASDWTDIQFGGRRQATNAANFNYIAASMTDPFAWVDTGISRRGGWHELMFQLKADGKIYFTLDGGAVGSTTRSDYTNLGTVGLYTMFDVGTLAGSGLGGSTIWDDVRVGSDIPEPATLALAGLALAGLAMSRRRGSK